MHDLIVDLPMPEGVDTSPLQKLWLDHVVKTYNVTRVWQGTSPIDGDDWMVLTTPLRRKYWAGLAPVLRVMPDDYEEVPERVARDVWALRCVSGETAGTVRKDVIDKYGSLEDVPARAKKWKPLAEQALQLLIFTENTLLSQHEQTTSSTNITVAPTRHYNLCEDLPALLNRCDRAPAFSLDFEFGADNDAEEEEDKDYSRAPVGVSLSWEEGHAEYVPMGHDGYGKNFGVNETMAPLFQLVRNHAECVMWNSKADMQIFMAQWDVDRVALQLFENPPHDVMLISYLMSLRPLGLKVRTYFDLGIRMQAITELIGKKPRQISFSQVPVEKAVPYGCQDADMTLRHWHEKREELYADGWKIYEEMERPLAVILAHAELKGIPFDRERMMQMWSEDAVEMRNLEQMIYTLAGTEWLLSSNEQTACVLYRKLGIPPQAPTKSFAPSVASDALYPIAPAYPIIPLLLRHRKLQKLEAGFYKKMLDQSTDWIHSKMNQAVVDTGRLSSKEPNMQQNPPKIRKVIIAPEGMNIGAADESQLELRIMAALSQCAIMQEAYLSDPPRDLHELTRIQTGLEDRRPAKVANFLTQYGGQAARFQIALAKNGIYWSLGRCATFLQVFFAGRPEIPIYWERMNEFCREHGYVPTQDGRRRYIDNITSPKPDERGNAERQAGNHPVQGTGIDIVKRAMVKTWRRIVELGGWMPLQIHDEILTINRPVDNDEVEALLREHMTNPNPIAPIPLKADINFGHSWGEVH